MDKTILTCLIAAVVLILGLSAIGTWDHHIELDHQTFLSIQR